MDSFLHLLEGYAPQCECCSVPEYSGYLLCFIHPSRTYRTAGLFSTVQHYTDGYSDSLRSLVSPLVNALKRNHFRFEDSGVKCAN
jgi:hypothetical protein